MPGERFREALVQRSEKFYLRGRLDRIVATLRDCHGLGAASRCTGKAPSELGIKLCARRFWRWIWAVRRLPLWAPTKMTLVATD